MVNARLLESERPGVAMAFFLDIFVGIKNDTYICNVIKRKRVCLFYYLGLKFYFFSNDHEPIHVHVSSGDAEAKFRVEPNIELIENCGLKPREIRQALMAIEENKEVIAERWNEYFGK